MLPVEIYFEKPPTEKLKVEKFASTLKVSLNDVIDISLNLSPFKPPAAIISAFIKEAKLSNEYRNYHSSELRSALSEFYNVPHEKIIVDSGSENILRNIILENIKKGDEVVHIVPNFTFFEKIFSHVRTKTKFLYTREDENFKIPENRLEATISHRTKLVILCNPNNPTGSFIEPSKISDLVDKFGKTLFLFDEAYGEFVNGSAIDLIQKHDNVIVTRTFSKAYGLAGLRIGYGIMSKDIVKKLLPRIDAYQIPAASEAAATESLKSVKVLEKNRTKLKLWTQKFRAKVNKISGLIAYNSSANFFLVNSKGIGITSTELFKELLKRGIIVRDCSSHTGLDNYFIRVCTSTPRKNKIVIEGLREILGG